MSAARAVAENSTRMAPQDIFRVSRLNLKGLDCADCAAKLEKKIAQIEGVKSARINFGASKLVVEHQIDLTRVLKTITESGYSAEVETGEPGPRSSTFLISGLDCADCAAKLQKKLSLLPGIEDVNINFGAAKMSVKHTLPVEKIVRAVDEAGYRADLATDTLRQSSTPNRQQRMRTISTAISGAFLAAGFLAAVLNAGREISVTLYILSMLSGGFYVARSGLYALRSFSLDMNFLMTVAVLGAAAIGEWAEGATVVFLFALGNLLQAYTLEKTRNSIKSLMDLSPKEALVKRDGREVTLPVEELVPGDVIIIRPGESIAMDGKVMTGQSTVNQAPITGESVPVKKKPGDEVFAGTINQQGALEVLVTKTVADTTLAKIIHLVEEAQAQRAPSQQFVDQFAKYYTPAVLAGAVAIAILPSLLFAMPFKPWLEKALILLVISCPCALVISTPVSIVSAIGSAAKKGVLIKGGAYLEKAGALKIIAMDKTGTLTAGRPEVTDVIALGNADKSRLLEIAAAIENRSEHPLARAILRYAEEQRVPFREVSGFESITGQGAKADIDGKTYYIGNSKLFEDLQIPLNNVKEHLERLQNQSKTVVMASSENNIIGLIAVADSPRENSQRAVESLYRSGISQVVMLTGDNQRTARAVAAEVGIKDFKAELLPQDKLETIKSLKSDGPVAMVGDGVNDAPALAAADLGIAMGGAGTDTAIDTADIVLMADDLSKLSYTIKISRKALGVIKQNIAFSILIKGAFIIATFLGAATLWMAVFADVGASLLVTLNGMRLMWVKES